MVGFRHAGRGKSDSEQSGDSADGFAHGNLPGWRAQSGVAQLVKLYHYKSISQVPNKRLMWYGFGMKKEIHPDNYRAVIFEDVTAGKRFLIGSTIHTEKTDKWDDGKEYPLFQVEISSASHPFYTGTSKTIDTAGRVERFKTRAAKAKPKAKK